MVSKRTVVVTALLALMVTVSGCSALQGGGSAQAEDIKQNAVESSGEVDSYRFNTTVTTERSGRTSTSNQSGSIDLANERARFHQTVRGQSITQYLVNGTAYVKSGGSWTKQNASGLSFWSNHPLEQQRRFLRNSSVSFEGNTTIAGQDVYELSVNVTAEQLRANAERQLGPNATAQPTFENISYTMYVTHDTSRIKRTNAEMSVTSQGRQSTFSTEMTFSNYNDVSIELPPEAKNAQSAN